MRYKTIQMPLFDTNDLHLYLFSKNDFLCHIFGTSFCQKLGLLMPPHYAAHAERLFCLSSTQVLRTTSFLGVYRKF